MDHGDVGVLQIAVIAKTVVIVFHVPLEKRQVRCGSVEGCGIITPSAEPFLWV
jgi:hypothetical protein